MHSYITAMGPRMKQPKPLLRIPIQGTTNTLTTTISTPKATLQAMSIATIRTMIMQNSFPA